ncbi:hypothetical protein F4814DRAFT_434524 [Daldinia grandis]|nr:hypothetical protein F4814DRAFT_434524 [Daldinia grandis]
MASKLQALSQALIENWQDPKILSISASRTTSKQLKEYLDHNYPDQYSVQLKRDWFTITITLIQGKEVLYDSDDGGNLRRNLKASQ